MTSLRTQELLYVQDLTNRQLNVEDSLFNKISYFKNKYDLSYTFSCNSDNLTYAFEYLITRKNVRTVKYVPTHHRFYVKFNLPIYGQDINIWKQDYWNQFDEVFIKM